MSPHASRRRFLNETGALLLSVPLFAGTACAWICRLPQPGALSASGPTAHAAIDALRTRQATTSLPVIHP